MGNRTVEMLRAVLGAPDAPVGTTPKQVVWRKNKARVYRWANDCRRAGDYYCQTMTEALDDSVARLYSEFFMDARDDWDRHSGFLHLIDWPPCLDRMVLALVADENDALDALLASLVEEPVDLPGGEQARLINDPNLFRFDIG